MKKVGRFRLGLFVLGSIGLAILSVFALGASSWLQPKLRVVTYFDESVQGLEVGSAIKFRGVQVGTVTDIRLPIDANYPLIEVEFAIPLEERQLLLTREEMQEKIDEMLERGMRIRLAVAGITGLRYLEADYLDPEKFPPPDLPFDPPDNYIPSAPSVIKSLETTVTQLLENFQAVEINAISDSLAAILDKLETVDTAELSKKLIRLLDDIHAFDLPKTGDGLRHLVDRLDTLVSDPRVDRLAETFETILSRVETLLNREEVDKILASADRAFAALADLSEQATAADGPVQKNLNALSGLVEKLDHTVATLDTQLNEAKAGETTAVLRETSREVSRTLRSIQHVEAELTILFRSFDRTLTKLERLADVLEKNPEALIHGKGD